MAKEEIVYRSKRLRELKYEIMRNSLRRVTNKDVVKEFQDATLFSIVADKENEEEMVKLFDLFNYITFGGFDYYHLTPIGEMLDEKESLIGMRSSLDVLINRDQLAKLKQVVECVPQLEFISSCDDNNMSYSIWNKNTNTKIDLIPFKRHQKGLEIKTLDNGDIDYEDEMFIRTGSHGELPYKSLSLMGEDESLVEHIDAKRLVK